MKLNIVLNTAEVVHNDLRIKEDLCNISEPLDLSGFWYAEVEKRKTESRFL